MIDTNMKRILDFVERNLTEDFSLSELARQCNFSPYYCSVIFHRYFGETMKSYMQKRRLVCAASELKNTNNRIIDIAIKYGYSSQEAFSRAFSTMIGMSPKRFRENPLPLAVYQKNSSPLFQNKESTAMKNETIKNVQSQIERNYPLKTLHILNGLCMLDSFQRDNLMNEKAVYIPFNEAMCWGETDEKIFSPEFIEKRAHSLNSTIEGYKKIVIEPLKPLFDEQFDIIVLWFGDDMFCQMNFITILSYLEQIHFDGDVLFCMAQEQKDKMLPDAVEIDTEGYNYIYKTILCDRKKCDAKMLPVTYQAMNLYLGYREENSDIIRYIKNNLNKKSLVEELLTLFSQYGLGDLQYQWMIEEIKKEKTI
ncbi:helix-turn-helix domain protein [Clostridium argentinense CDC 2741]|uniref:Helix-turn-helix domain protein n=1 Tax=Clostridium argentinense CDC 2741 TaxID=1418104 RepID=A0A0C1U3B4_9CLOT|nr:AraC family transcriptional regulator [Clostridium argentinense]ARC83416.1 AraC family transcriptional regulator [Clostridium argentinense]KIE45963.1 helix-turn-helix domain protein [Clostridium argentinense CDC 2741]NFF39138.1 helix-turn-helix transcriptional regulator [Clostridium argentinense]NFP49550.1 helix-turn-helix transcriptional regulator [Clostridium argentinense]NFP72253.1 helix-turn-helix transcriptional regulator [Clostridium argentinense]